MLTIGSRGSQLALWQANYILNRLAAQGIDARILVIQTTGDRITDVSLSQLGSQTSTKGLFTKELEEALLDGRIDLAVHSLKDMPTELPAGLRLAAIPAREDVRDALIGKTLDELPLGAKVGTSALRRQAQLRALRPDLEVEDIRGNVDTRLRKLDEGQYDAIMLAAAGLRRLGWGGRISQYLSLEEMCPAVGQGALAIETTDAFHGVDLLDEPHTRAAVTAERALLRALGGGCQVPIGAHASYSGGTLHLRAVVASADGALLIRQEDQGPAASAAELGARLGDALIEGGAREILDDAGA
ncbi:MAG: hydroxymethylbilane synthase [Bryobacteraceae bacterium]|nr:hydroxymethylbilane synthase [Bryobacteraceae bacterium]